MSNLVKNNSDLYILFDAKFSNPNGNIDDDNKPRIDEETQKALISSVCWKRLDKEYRKNYYNQTLFYEKGIAKIDRLKQFGIDLTQGLDPEEVFKRLASECCDLRIYGGLLASSEKVQDDEEEVELEEEKAEEAKSTRKKKNKKKGDEKKVSSSYNAIGAVQFNIGESLNPVEIVSALTTITCVMPEKEKDGTTKGGNSIGKDYRLNYALMAISGTVNAFNAAKLGMTEEDLRILDESMINALNLRKTFTKVGQKTRFYVRIEYNHPRVLNNDFLANYVEMQPYNPNKKIERLADYYVDITRFVDLLLKEKSEVIEAVHVYHDPLLNLVYNNNKVPKLADFIKELGFTVNEVKVKIQ